MFHSEWTQSIFIQQESLMTTRVVGGAGPLPQLHSTVHPINIMRMNHRVVLMAYNCMSTDSIIVPALLTFLIVRWQRPPVRPLYLTAGAIISAPYYCSAFNEEHHHQPFRFNEKSHLLRRWSGPQRQAAI